MTRRAAIVVVLAVVLGGGSALAARTSGLRPVQIESNSMAPTVRNGDWIVVDDLGPGARPEIARGDIVMFRFPLGTSGRAIKRVIAREGDRVAISARTVTVNGRAIAIAGAPVSAQPARARVEIVPQRHVFLLGDNHARSIDSRSFGAVPESALVAREVVVIGGSGLLWALAAVAAIGGALLLLVARLRVRI